MNLLQLPLTHQSMEIIASLIFNGGSVGLGDGYRLRRGCGYAREQGENKCKEIFHFWTDFFVALFFSF